jgi:hypothetical protein
MTACSESLPYLVQDRFSEKCHFDLKIQKSTTLNDPDEGGGVCKLVIWEIDTIKVKSQTGN